MHTYIARVGVACIAFEICHTRLSRLLKSFVKKLPLNDVFIVANAELPNPAVSLI